MTKRNPAIHDRYADSEDVVNIDVAFKIFATGSSYIDLEEYLGTENVSYIRSILKKNYFVNLYSNYGYILAFLVAINGFILILRGGDYGVIYLFSLASLAVVFAVAICIQIFPQFPADDDLVSQSPPAKRGAMSVLIEFKTLLANGSVLVYEKSDKSVRNIRKIRNSDRFKQEYGVVWIIKSMFPGLPIKTLFGKFIEGKLVVRREDVLHRVENIKSVYGDDYSILLRSLSSPKQIKLFNSSEIDALERIFSKVDLMDNPSVVIFKIYRMHLHLRAQNKRYSAADIGAACDYDLARVEKVLRGKYPALSRRLKQAVERASVPPQTAPRLGSGVATSSTRGHEPLSG
jgi:hypothetical protein